VLSLSRKLKLTELPLSSNFCAHISKTAQQKIKVTHRHSESSAGVCIRPLCSSSKSSACRWQLVPVAATYTVLLIAIWWWLWWQ